MIDGSTRISQRWTAAGLGLVLLLFVAGIATIGLTHQTAWLFMRTDPIVWNSFEVRARVQEAVNLAAPHRIALEVACEQGHMTAGYDNGDLGLPGGDTHRVDEHVESIAARVVDAPSFPSVL